MIAILGYINNTDWFDLIWVHAGTHWSSRWAGSVRDLWCMKICCQIFLWDGDISSMPPCSVTGENIVRWHAERGRGSTSAWLCVCVCVRTNRGVRHLEWNCWFSRYLPAGSLAVVFSPPSLSAGSRALYRGEASPPVTLVVDMRFNDGERLSGCCSTTH